MRRPSLLLAPFAVTALLLAGCGGDDDDAADDTTTTEAVDESTTTGDDDTSEPTDGSSDPSTSESTEPTDTTEGGSTGDDHEFCSELQRVEDAFADVGEDADSIEATRTSIDQIIDALDDITPGAPDDIKGSLEAYTDLMGDVKEIADDAATVEEFETEASATFSDDEFADDADNIEAWIDGNCPSLAGE